MIIMKIVFIEKDIDVMGGVERIINTLANEFSKIYDVNVVSEHKNNINTFFKYDDKIKIHYIQDRMKSNSKNKKCNNPILLKVKKLINSLSDYYIYKLLNDEIYDCIVNSDCIVFGRVNTALNFMPLLKKINSQKKIIVRDAIHLDLYKYYDKIRMKKYFPNIVDTLIVSSEESLNKYETFFKLKNKRLKILKIYNPLGIIPSLSMHDSSNKIVSLGRLDKQKGFENLILAFKVVHLNNPKWILDIYGDGPEKQELINLIKENHLENVITIKKPIKDVSTVFAESSIYVMTSRYEGYANTLVEALACGIPSISYNWLMGVDDIIDDGENGLIVKLDDRKKYFYGSINKCDINNLANAIIKLIENPELRKKISSNSIEIIKSRKKDIIIKKWREVIEK